MATDSTKLLDRILRLIDSDIKRIRKDSKAKQLEPQTALTLTRYATAVSAINTEKAELTKREKNKLSKLSTEELMKIYVEKQKEKETK